MITTTTRRMATVLAGAGVTAAIFAGSAAAATPASAQPAGNSCVGH